MHSEGDMETSKVAEPISGDKLYQKRARKVLPILVRQAEAGMTIYYSALAREIGIPNPRTLNYVLGSIGITMKNLSRAWKQKVPPIQCIVSNKNTGFPGEGVGGFLTRKEFSSMSRKQKAALVNEHLRDIFSFPRWQDVLTELSLKPAKSDYSIQVEKGAAFRGGGESNDHKRLKLYISRHPTAVGLPSNTPRGAVEFPLSSGDCADLCFQDREDWIAVEVKSALSSEADLIRGLFQCVKYKAVLEAMQALLHKPQNARAILALEGSISPALVGLQNVLGIEVVDQVYGKGRAQRF